MLCLHSRCFSLSIFTPPPTLSPPPLRHPSFIPCAADSLHGVAGCRASACLSCHSFTAAFRRSRCSFPAQIALAQKPSVYPQRAARERAASCRGNLSGTGSSKAAIKQDRCPSSPHAPPPTPSSSVWEFWSLLVLVLCVGFLLRSI